MKRLGFAVFAIAVLALPLCAQVTSVRADIPFEFVAGSTTVEPGQYVINARTGSPVVWLEGSKCYSILSNPADTNASSEKAKLVFHRYGDQYFLARISTTSAARDLPISRVERELKKTVAAAGQRPTEVLVAMR